MKRGQLYDVIREISTCKLSGHTQLRLSKCIEYK
jgi:hypothetical protein